MASLTNTFESAASGTTVSTSNSEGPSSRAFDNVLQGSGATIAYDNAHPHSVGQGTQSLKVQTAAGAGITTVVWNSTSAPTTSDIYGRAYLYYTALPGAAWRWFQAFGGGAIRAAFNISTTGTLQVVRSTGSVVASTSTAFGINTLWRFEFLIHFSATVGVAIVDCYNGDSGTITETLDTTGTPDNFGGATADEYRFGINVTQASRGPYWIDDININDVGFPGPFKPSFAPRRRPPLSGLLQR